ncbi:MAG: hypothetical protein IKP06_06055 [Elusimicrobiaceae bacterium]|nr:hypothetical protein [Elusimicrobiaceae bacterium]
MRKIFFVLFSMIFVEGSVCAQIIPLSHKGAEALYRSRPFVQALNRKTPLALGNYKVGFLSPQPKHYASYLPECFLGSSLDYSAYPRLAQRNDARALQALQDFAKHAVRFETNLSHISTRIQNHVFTKKVPYANFLPQDIDVLYIGETHEEMRVQKEIVSLVSQLPSIYPGRTIYLAAEIIPTLEEWTAEENIILTLDELADRLDVTAPVKTIQVLKAALNAQIPLYGLEDDVALILASTPRKQKLPTMKQLGDFAVSWEGIALRNRLFARKIRALQIYDPGALIVVYGGMFHMAYHNQSSLPSLLKGKSFVVQVTIPHALPAANPLFSNMLVDEATRQQFNASPSAKLVESWKDPGSYNKLLGNDLTVIVHEE